MKFEQELIFEAYNNAVLNEGGAAGHMYHPFDLPEVNSIDDLVNVLYNSVDILNKGTATVKLDGVNLSLKVVDDERNETFKRQFALDRGSQKVEDVHGITLDGLSTRFPEGHGLIDKGKTILTIMDKSIPLIKNDLVKLGMWNDSTKFLNTEYIDGQENVIDYGDKKLIAFHSVNQFVEKRNRKGELTRPGLKPKPNVKETSRVINYDNNALNSLREKVNTIANQYGFEVITGIYVTKKGVPNFDSVLNKPFTVQFDDKEKVTKPLKTWIKEVGKGIPKKNRVKTLDGKDRGAVSKDVYLTVLNGTPLDSVFKTEDINTAVAGALTYHITKELGQEILRNYTTDNYGDTDKHEGIVLTDTSYGKDNLGNPNSIKITGDFILSGMGGKLASNRPKVSDEEDQSAPAANYGNGGMDFSSYFTNPRSETDPGGSGFKAKSVK